MVEWKEKCKDAEEAGDDEEARPRRWLEQRRVVLGLASS